MEFTTLTSKCSRHREALQMVGIRRTLAVLIVGSAFLARPALGQQGASVSLTHTVSVTVPPRIKVQVASAAQMASSVQTAHSDGLAVSVSATQSWTLSIGSPTASSKVQWSTERSSGFSPVSHDDAPVASGDISPVPTAATVFFRNAAQANSKGSDVVTLTVVAP
jgi:hypothetical protein